MQKQLNLILTFFLIGCLGLLAGCKDEDNEPETDPREETLQMLRGQEGKTWTIHTVHVNGANATSLLEDCNRDDLYIFYPEGEGEVQGHENKCMENEPSTLVSGSWELHEDLETLSLNLPPFFEEDVEILELTDERLQIRKEEDGETIMVTFHAAE